MTKIERIKEEVNKTFKEADFLAIGRNIHRNHKNKKLTIKNKSYLHSIYTDKSRNIIIMKSVQCGVSEYLYIRALMRSFLGNSVLYVLPTFLVKNLIVQERINKSIAFTKFYQDILQQEAEGLAGNTSIKQLGTGTIIFTGSNTETSFISHQIDDVIIDELDSCSKIFLPMAEERQSASVDKHTIKVGNPTIINSGIDAEYKKSDRKRWFIKHDCGEWINPDFFKHVVQREQDDYFIIDPDNQGADVRCVCDKCHKPFDRFSPGEWVAETQSDVSGYHISKMFSTQTTLGELLVRFQEGLANDTILQRFYNGDLGLAYNTSGSNITSTMLDGCIEQGYNMPSGSEGMCIAGIDVGSVFDIIIGRVEDDKIRIVNISELPVQDINEVLDLFRQYNVKLYVIDAMPETRIARMIIARWAHGFMNYYGQAKKELTINARDNIINSNRTVALDQVKESIILNAIILPQNAPSIQNFYSQITSSTRIYDKAKDEFSWVESGADHKLHALSYLMLARRIIAMVK